MIEIIGGARVPRAHTILRLWSISICTKHHRNTIFSFLHPLTGPLNCFIWRQTVKKAPLSFILKMSSVLYFKISALGFLWPFTTSAVSPLRMLWENPCPFLNLFSQALRYDFEICDVHFLSLFLDVSGYSSIFSTCLFYSCGNDINPGDFLNMIWNRVIHIICCK